MQQMQTRDSRSALLRAALTLQYQDIGLPRVWCEQSSEKELGARLPVRVTNGGTSSVGRNMTMASRPTSRGASCRREGLQATGRLRPARHAGGSGTNLSQVLGLVVLCLRSRAHHPAQALETQTDGSSSRDTREAYDSGNSHFDPIGLRKDPDEGLSPAAARSNSPDYFVLSREALTWVGSDRAALVGA
jgi:hypothetical protein